MAHADSGTMMAWLDGELPVGDRSAIESHLATCGSCKTELEELRGFAAEFSGAIALLDAPAPMLRARARLQPLLESGHRPAAARIRAIPAGLLKAAAVVLLVAGAASAAIPGTPLRRLVESIAARVGIISEPTPVTPVFEAPAPVIAAPPIEEQRQPGNEFGVAPAMGRARVSIHAPVDGATIAVRLVDSPTVRVIAMSADETRVESGTGYIDVYDNTAGMIVEVPRDLASMTVEVDGRLYFVKDGDQTRLVGPGSQSGPGEFVFQAHTR